MTNRTKAIAGLSGMFLLGALCGALLLGLFVRGRMHDAQRMRDRQGFQAFFTDRLRLTETQRDSLHDELERTYDELAELRRNTAQRYDVVLDSFRQRVQPILTTEQREILEQEEKRLRRILPRDPRRVAPPGMPGGPMRMRPDAPSGAPPGPESGMDQSRSPKSDSTAAAAPNGADALIGGSGAGAGAGEVGPNGGTNGGAMLGEGPIMKRLRERLNLSKDQTIAVKAAFASLREKMRRDRKDLAGMPRMQMAAARQSFMDFDAEVTGILRPDQRQAYAQLRQELRDSLRSRLARQPGALSAPRP